MDEVYSVVCVFNYVGNIYLFSIQLGKQHAKVNSHRNGLGRPKTSRGLSHEEVEEQ